MWSHKVVEHPIAIQSPLECLLVLGIRVGASSVAREKASQSAVERLQVIGVNVLHLKGLGSIGVFLDRSLIRGTLAAFLMSLAPFVFDTHLDPLFRVVGGRPTFPVRITS